jgi:hypothetical protein
MAKGLLRPVALSGIVAVCAMATALILSPQSGLAAWCSGLLTPMDADI